MKDQPTFSKDSIRKEMERNRNYENIVKNILVKELQDNSSQKTSQVTCKEFRILKGKITLSAGIQIN